MTSAQTTTRDVPVGEIAPDRLMAHIAEFAKRVKLSGTPEERESFLYLESTMRSYGYRTELLQHDAYISLPVSSRLVVDGVEVASITHSMSASTGAAGRSAAVVYVGEGEPQDFAAADVRGRIVLVDGIAVEGVAARASRAGAIGQIHVSPTEHLYEMCVSPVWGSPSQLTRGALPTTAAATISRQDGARLRSRCLAGETVLAEMTTVVDTGWRKTPLLTCHLDPPDHHDAPFVLFSGHHDTWHYGVMDNGGANATMLEAARVLAQHRAAWRRGLRVCFWSGHSHGRYSGSAWYADEHFIALERRCAAHVNVDSTGGVGASVLTDSGVVDELQAVARDAVAAETGQVHRGARQGRNADQSFWGIGIPAMFGSLSHQPKGDEKMLAALGWWWHTPHDLADKIDPDNLGRDTRITLRALWRLVAEPVLPLDYTVYADNLTDELDRIGSALAGSFDIAPLRDAALALRHAAAAVPSARDAGRDRAVDAALIRASRELVPVNYTSGDRFRPDPATPLPPWFALQGLRDLAAAEPSEQPFFAVEARRTRNRVLAALAAATAHLDSLGPAS